MKKSCDTNQLIASLLRDLASVQSSTQKNLETPIESFLRPDGTLGKIKHVGPSADHSGGITDIRLPFSRPLQAAAPPEVEKRRDFGPNFLRAQVVAALQNRAEGSRSSRLSRRLQMHSAWFTARRHARHYRGVHDAQLCLLRHHGSLVWASDCPWVSMANLARQHRDRSTESEVFGAVPDDQGHRSQHPPTASTWSPASSRAWSWWPHHRIRGSARRGSDTSRIVRGDAGRSHLGHPRGRKLGARPGITAD